MHGGGQLRAIIIVIVIIAGLVGFGFLLITGVFQSSRLGFQGGRGRPGAIDGADVGGAAVLAARRPGVAARELPGTQQRARSRGAVGVRRPVLPSSLVRFAVRG